MASGNQRRPRDYFYGEVLQLPPGTKKPDHYALLGVPYFEADHDTLLRAALARIRLLESCQADPRPAYRKMLRQLISEVRDAQMTLLDPARRRAYDRSLTGQKGDEKKQEEEPELELRVGTMIAGRYRVMGEVRRGGLGIVYEAMDKNLRTRVHLSVLRPGLSKDRRTRRPIEQAARSAAALDHPNLLRVDEVGEVDRLLFVRTRAIEAKNILEQIEATPQMRVESDEVRRVVRDVAAALALVHEQGAVHGDLRPHNVFVDESGRVLVADSCLTRAVTDAAKAEGSRYREPENEASPRGDLFSLGCLAYQMLSGIPPFAAGAAGDAKPLPDDVPDDLDATVMELLARRPEQRPKSAAEVLERLTPRVAPRRRPTLLAAGALVLVAVAAGVFAIGSGGDDPRGSSVKEQAWRLIAERKFDEAIESLRRARQSDPNDSGLLAPLAKALEASALRLEKSDPWTAQLELTEARQLESTTERTAALARVEAAARQRLAEVPVAAPAVAAEPTVQVAAGDVPLRSITVDGKERDPAQEEFALRTDLDDGAYEIPFVLVDRAGNRRTGKLTVVVDRKPPEVEILAPEDGARLRKGTVLVHVRVTDDNPAKTVSVRGRPVKLEGGEAADVFQLGDGAHKIEVIAKDRAGHEGRASRSVVVDSKAPEVELAASRVVTRDGRAKVRGTVLSPVKTLTVAGRPVEVRADGTFDAVVTVARDGRVAVEAVGLTGLSRKVSMEVVVDKQRPAVSVQWKRKDGKGALLYGSREMDAGLLALPVVARDKTQVTFEPSEGTVEGGTWRLAPHEGARTVQLRVVDEAGNATTLSVAVEGHRAIPRLVVKNTTDRITNAEEATLDIDADVDVLVQGKLREPGRVKVPLPEGRVELKVEARDRYGNETIWTKALVVDRTSPTLSLVGDAERGIGGQTIEIEANEPLATVTCVGKTFPVNGKIARFHANLQVGRRRLHVVAKDLAGNVAKRDFPLRVRNRVLVLDGRSAVRVPFPRTLPLQSFTVECWVRGYEPERTMSILSNWDNSDFALVWSLKKGFPYAVVYGEKSGRLALQVKRGWKWGDWTHIALCHDGRRVRFFVNGSQQATEPMADRMKRGRAALYIGAEPGRRGPGYFFHGAIDEVRISNVARYTRGFSPARYHKEDDKTVLLLRFDTRRDNQLFADSSGRGFHGETVGRPQLIEENR